mmetsp:Transcript_16384/g.20427  ORF Transcript_16384/g.20427 Transcript_16384/m.20427 type:complete len:150 (+) Transcript_16384:74-523(+)|eukprot:CAMPEP_0172503172 /NCGR_PEP_ID=MMETSP1066-20121228/166884_1 /TAXON_ID=671091 /ORGANISM="Coscinodiscus wailesii, Strain CCMP2513" /LENGTH=149 /DNA_ID=CAMNT_0013278793 /DNA_START=69 /DNA_END=518 /DNA_ORIENTATION=+
MKNFTSILSLIFTTLTPTSSFLPSHHYLSVTDKTSNFQTATATTTSLSATPIAIVVEAEIKEDRVDELLTLIETNAKSSREEPGCLRFDVLRSQDQPNKFFFYEVYEDADAIAFHKTQPHYALWNDFKESGGTVSSVSYKTDGLFLTGS